MSVLEDFVEFKVRKYSKYSTNIIYLTYIKETLTTDPVLFDQFIEKYKKTLADLGEKNAFLVVNSKEIKNIDFSYTRTYIIAYPVFSYIACKIFIISIRFVMPPASRSIFFYLFLKILIKDFYTFVIKF